MVNSYVKQLEELQNSIEEIHNQLVALSTSDEDFETVYDRLLDEMAEKIVELDDILEYLNKVL